MTLNTPAVPAPPQPPESADQMRLRYVGTCSRCGNSLAKGTEALYDSSTRTVRCIVCQASDPAAIEAVDDSGAAGSSAHREFERRMSAREHRVKARLGEMLGGVVLAITEEPQSTRAWEQGSVGEQKLAEALGGLPEIKLLHDRRVPGIKGNIDHILVAPSGVFVVDAKRYKGTIQIRDEGGLFKTDKRLYVGRRDCSHLAANMGWQVEAVRRALVAAGIQPMPPIVPVLCFVDGEWPLLFPPEEYSGVRLEGMRSIKKLVASAPVLPPEMTSRIHRVLIAAFPTK